MAKRWMLILAALLVLGAPTLFALDLSVGPKGGLSHNFSFGSDFKDLLEAFDTNQQLKIGFTIGGFLELGLSPAFAIQPEVFYTTIGYKVKDFEDFTARFIAFDVLLKGRFGGFNVFAGPDMHIGIGDWSIDSIDISKEDRDAMGMRNTHFAVVAGAGAVFPAGAGQLGVEARAVIGLQNIVETDPEPSWKFASIAVLASYAFRIK